MAAWSLQQHHQAEEEQKGRVGLLVKLGLWVILSHYD